MLKSMAQNRTSALDTLFCQDMMDASQVEGVESFLLSGICGPRPTAIHQCADDTGFVHYHLGLHCQSGDGPHL